MGYLGYYGYGSYWGGGGLWGAGIYPDVLQAGLQEKGTRTDTSAGPAEAVVEQHQHDDPHLRSGNAVMRYYVHASDGDMGHVEGFLVDEKTWAIRYLIVNTSNWWLGHEVLIAPQWIDHVDWTESTVSVGLTREADQALAAVRFRGTARSRTRSGDPHSLWAHRLLAARGETRPSGIPIVGIMLNYVGKPSDVAEYGRRTCDAHRGPCVLARK